MTTQTWRYHLPNEKNEGWAIIFMDAIGCFSALSDFGSYGYRWHEAGWGPGDFREFFIGADDDYILGKIAGKDEYDSAATLASVKRHILESRRVDQHVSKPFWTQRMARIEWDLLEDRGDLDFEADFNDWATDTHLDEPWSYFCRGPSSDAKMFVARVLPRLRAAIRAQLAEEAAARLPVGA